MVRESPCEVCLQEHVQGSHCSQQVCELSLCTFTLHRGRHAQCATPHICSMQRLF